MQAVDVTRATVFQGIDDDEERVGRGIDHRGAGNAIFWADVIARDARAGNGGDYRCMDEGAVPQGGDRRGSVSVEGIELIVLGSDEDYIVGRSPDCHIRHIQRLRVDLSIDVILDTFAELVHIDVAGIEDRLVELMTGATKIILIRCHCRVSRGQRRLLWPCSVHCGERDQQGEDDEYQKDETESDSCTSVRG